MLMMAAPVMAGKQLWELSSTFMTGGIAGALNDEQVKKELKITKDQSAEIKKILAKSDKRESGDGDKIFKIPEGPDKYSKIHDISKSRADQLFEDLGKTLSDAQMKRLKQIMLQKQGITIFETRGIREQLKLNDEDVKRLVDANETARKTIQKQFFDKKMTMQEVNDKIWYMSWHLPDEVFAELNEKQRKAVKEMLGEPYVDKKK